MSKFEDRSTLRAAKSVNMLGLKWFVEAALLAIGIFSRIQQFHHISTREWRIFAILTGKDMPVIEILTLLEKLLVSF